MKKHFVGAVVAVLSVIVFVTGLLGVVLKLCHDLLPPSPASQDQISNHTLSSLLAIATTLLSTIVATTSVFAALKGSKPDHKVGNWLIYNLSVIRWMFSTNREYLDDCLRDLKREKRHMSSKKLNPSYILLCLWLKALECFLKIIWIWVMQLLRQLAGAAELIRKIIGRG